jgi:hypothetical protein
MSLEEFAVCFAITMVAAVVHGSAGMGFALLAAPVLILINPSLVPGPLLGAGLTLTLLMAIREREAADLEGVRWAVLGCVVGAAVAIPVIRMLTPLSFAIVFAGLLLLAVGFSAVGLHVRPSRKINLGGGFASGFMGTISAVGGPPLALVYQHASGPRIRSTLAVYFTFAGLLSIGALFVAGKMGSNEVVLAGYLCPGLIVGYLVSSYTRRFLDKRMLRPMVLILATAAAVAVVVKALL